MDLDSSALNDNSAIWLSLRVFGSGLQRDLFPEPLIEVASKFQALNNKQVKDLLRFQYFSVLFVYMATSKIVTLGISLDWFEHHALKDPHFKMQAKLKKPAQV